MSAGNSNLKNSVATGKGKKVAVAPPIRLKLNKFDPTTFPIQSSFFFAKTADKDAANSGKLVPRAMTETPTKTSLTPILKDNSCAPITRLSAPKDKKIAPNKM